MFGKTDYNRAYRIGKKLYHSNEFRFVKKNIGNKKFYKKLGTKIRDTDYKKLASDPNTYKAIGKGLDRVDKIHQGIGKSLTDINPELGMMYDEATPTVSYGLQKGSRAAKRTGRTLEKARKSKGALQKGVVLGQGAVSVAREFL